MATHVLLVRHGESTWNAERRWQGRADPPLSRRGEIQAEQAAAGLAALELDVVATSALRRARRTGELLAEHASLSLGGAHGALDERAAGPWEGLRRVEIEARDPGFLENGRRPEGYEGDVAVIARARAALVRLAHDHAGGSLVVVSHGGVIGALERAASPPGSSAHRPGRLDNLEGRWFVVDGPDLTVRGGRIRLLTDGSDAVVAGGSSPLDSSPLE